MKVNPNQQEDPAGQGRLEVAVLIGLILFILISVYLLLAPERHELKDPGRSPPSPDVRQRM